MTDPGFPLAGRRVWVAGHRGMVGAALARRLEGEGCEVLTADRAEVDLRRQADVEDWIRSRLHEGGGPTDRSGDG